MSKAAFVLLWSSIVDITVADWQREKAQAAYEQMTRNKYQRRNHDDETSAPPVRDQQQHGITEMEVNPEGGTVLRKVDKAKPAAEVGASRSPTYGLGGQSLQVSSWESPSFQKWQKWKISALVESAKSQVKRKTTQSFEEWAKTAPWDSLGQADQAEILEKLTEFIEQPHPLRTEPCKEVAAEITDKDCTETVIGSDQVFTGPRKNGKAFMIDVSIFGFDLDALEIKLHELNQTVDLFALIESPVTLQGDSKPLMWARNKDQERFQPFKDKILHLVVDIPQDTNFKKVPGVSNFTYENMQERLGIEKLKEMMAQILPSNVDQEVLLNYGDADELAHPRSVALMKHCEPAKLPVDSGAWMPMGRFDQAFKTDFPVRPDLPYTFGNPTFVALDDLHVGTDSSKYDGARSFGKSDRYLLGGWHLTLTPHVPFRILKYFASPTAPGKLGDSHVAQFDGRISSLLRQGDTEAVYQGFSDLTWETHWKERMKPVKELSEEQPYKEHSSLLEPPKITQCTKNNKERFEAWFGRYDRRLKVPISTPDSETVSTTNA